MQQQWIHRVLARWMIMSTDGWIRIGGHLCLSLPISISPPWSREETTGRRSCHIATSYRGRSRGLWVGEERATWTPSGQSAFELVVSAQQPDSDLLQARTMHPSSMPARTHIGAVLPPLQVEVGQFAGSHEDQSVCARASASVGFSLNFYHTYCCLTRVIVMRRGKKKSTINARAHAALAVDA